MCLHTKAEILRAAVWTHLTFRYSSTHLLTAHVGLGLRDEEGDERLACSSGHRQDFLGFPVLITAGLQGELHREKPLVLS